MDRRSFLKRIGLASVGAVVAYSFPEVIVPKNIEQLLILPEQIPIDFISELNRITMKEIYPRMIEDNFFKDTPFLTFMREGSSAVYKGRQMGKFTFNKAITKMELALEGYDPINFESWEEM